MDNTICVFNVEKVGGSGTRRATCELDFERHALSESTLKMPKLPSFSALFAKTCAL